MRKTLRIALSIAALLCFGPNVIGQHSGVISQYMFNGLLLNPAYAGSQKTMAVNINYRNQWTGFDGAPKSQIASAHSPLNKIPLSVGGSITRDEAGVSSDIQVKAIGAYKLEVEKGDLQVGIGAGFGMSSSRWTDVIIENPDDPLFQQDTRGLIRPIFSTGVYYQNKKWYAGYSLPSLLEYSFPNAEDIESSFALDGLEHMVTAGYVHEINRQVVLKPSMLLRVLPNSGFQFDINANVIFRKKIWTGLSYRHMDAVIALLEYQVHHQLRLGYAFDYTLNPIGRYTAGSHEIALMWAFRRKSFARNPRYF